MLASRLALFGRISSQTPSQFNIKSCVNVVLTSESLDKVLPFDHSKKTSSAELSFAGIVRFWVFYKMEFGYFPWQ